MSSYEILKISIKESCSLAICYFEEQSNKLLCGRSLCPHFLRQRNLPGIDYQSCSGKCVLVDGRVWNTCRAYYQSIAEQLSKNQKGTKTTLLDSLLDSSKPLLSYPSSSESRDSQLSFDFVSLDY